LEFDPEQVLAVAADAFLTHGYAGTSVAMVAEAAGVGKQSLYNTFGDKPALFQQALGCAAGRVGATVASMASAPTGRAALHAFFDQVVTDCASADPVRRHCMVSAGLLEGIDDTDVQHALRRAWVETRDLLRTTLLRGQHDGSVTRAVPADVLADHLMTSMSGLRVAARARVGVERLRASAALALHLLDPPGAPGG
jgi:TetR/AcrR family transcriptional repressor of nem operon